VDTAPTVLEEFVRMPELEILHSCSSRYLYRLIARGEFPRPVRLGADGRSGPAVWRKSEVAKWQADRVRAASQVATDVIERARGVHATEASC
jgi:prophage regulatory protein